MSTLRSLFAWIGRMLKRLFSPQQRSPELEDLEAQFDKQLDPERVQDRQLSNSIRSGRG